MGTMVRIPGRPVSPGRRSTRFLSALLVPVVFAGCAHSFRPAGRAVPGPADAIAAAPLANGRIAVLAGTDEAKGLFIIDEQSGVVRRSFGVTKEATGVTAESADGPLLLSVGAERDGRFFGAVEEWTLAGVKRQIVPLPTEGLGITRVVGGVAYVLLGGSNAVRAAMPLTLLPALHVGQAIPLDAGASALEQCGTAGSRSLLYTEATHGWLTIRDIRTGGEARSTVAANGATCFADGDRADGDRAYAIVGGDVGRSISVMSVPALGEVFTLPASRDAIALYESDDHHLVALNSTHRLASIETFRDDSQTKTASKELAAAQPPH
jgi:hypothetical protein